MFVDGAGLGIIVPTATSTIPNRWMIWDSFSAARTGDPNGSWTTIPEDAWNMSCMTSFGFGDNIKTIIGGDARALSLCYKVLSGNTDNGAAPGLLQNVRAGQSQRGLGAISPLGSIDESVQLQQLKENLKQRRLNVALSTAGRVPISRAMPLARGRA